MPVEEWLDCLINHEIAYSSVFAQLEETEYGAFLHAPSLPEYGDANRALRLRCGGRSAEWVAKQVISYFTARGNNPIADVDPIAELEGIGTALRELGVVPVQGHRLLMHYESKEPPTLPASEIVTELVPNETGSGEASQWIATAVADDIGWPDADLWRKVADCEARSTACRLILARLRAVAAGACDLFEFDCWARVESVVTAQEIRRRGVGAALVARAVHESLTRGNLETYLFTEPGGAAERLYRRMGFVPWHLNIFQRHQG